MKTQPQLSYRARALAAPVALLALLLPAAVAAQHGGHGGGGGHQGGGHSSGGHGGGHSSSGHHDRGHSGGSHHGGHSSFGHLGGHLSLYVHRHGYGYPYYGDSYYGYPYYGGYSGSYSGAGAMGALDLDIRPGRTLVYDEEQYVGTVDDFDGFPAYLWLSAGTHEITFYLEGHRTMVRQYTVSPGQIVRVSGTLERGDSVRPEDFPADRPALRPSADRQRRSGPVSDLRQEPGQLNLEVVPADASVYLDGRFVGTGRDLAEGLLIDPGSHVLEVVRPDYQSEKRSFEVEPNEEVEQRIELERP